MNDSTYVPTTEDQINLCFAFLSYIGESLKQQPGTTKTIYDDINSAMPQVPVLCKNGTVDWEIVWGPAIYTYELAEKQDSGMFVARQISNPANFVVAIRGTNAKALDDWIFEDFAVITMHDWPRANDAKISSATHEGINLLQNKLIPDAGLPGDGENIATFLKNICSQPFNISFTGHSLGGALAPTLALLFKQLQGEAGGFDPNSNATITCTAFAGATAGNAEFSSYSNSQFSNTPIRRIHDTNDIVPHAWTKSTMEELKTLYDSAGIHMKNDLKLLLDGVILSTELHNYTQIDNSVPITLPIDISQGDSYFAQAGYQHDKSYPLIILGESEGKALIKLIDSFE